MLNRLIKFIRRPDINAQNTGHEAFQQYQGYILSGVNGNGGQGVRRTIAATQLATIAVGPTHKLNDPTATGNANVNLELQSLTGDLTPSSIANI